MKKMLSLTLAGCIACSMMFGFTACDLLGGSGNTPPTDSSTAPTTPDTPTTPDSSNTPTTPDTSTTPPPPVEFTAVQELDYTDSAATIYNPDQGFYTPIGVKVTTNGITYSKNHIGTARLYHLRMDISAFSSKNAGGSDRALTTAALDGIHELLQSLHERNDTAIVRFCYAPNFGGDANCEPSLQQMVEHIEQICTVVNDYPTVITAVEVGMVGPWGEMHTSEIVKNPATINTLIDTFLKNTISLPVLVRTPRMIYNYLELPDHLDIYRLGMFNDGYLGSDTDYGTYQNREEDIAFLSGQTAHLPFGGEVIEPASPLHDIEVCLPEMYQIHLSYLNEQWNNTVVAKWKNTQVSNACLSADPLYYGKTAYEYIQGHMGYRFVLRNSKFTYTENYANLKIALTLENVGFGNLNKPKKAKLLFVTETGRVAYQKAMDDYNGESTVNYSLPVSLVKGKYDVYLRLYGDEWNESPRYALQFANGDIYNATLSANRIGKIEIV